MTPPEGAVSAKAKTVDISIYPASWTVDMADPVCKLCEDEPCDRVRDTQLLGSPWRDCNDGCGGGHLCAFSAFLRRDQFQRRHCRLHPW